MIHRYAQIWFFRKWFGNSFSTTFCVQFFDKNISQVIVSATLSGEETLKYPPFHGICFFDEIFSFFNLESDFFSKWNFSENGFSVLILRYWFMYIFDIRNYKIYFFHAKICFDNNFYFNKFIYVLFLQNLNNFVSFKTPAMERWFIHMKIPVTAPALPVL